MIPVLKKCCVLLKKLPESEGYLQSKEEYSQINNKNESNKENLTPQSLYMADFEKNCSSSAFNLYKCTECSQSFNRRSSLTSHFQAAHSLVCSECRMTFSYYNDLITHSESFHLNYNSVEELCATGSKNNSIHCPEKKIPFKCHLCDRVFNHAITLSLHYQNVHRSFHVTESFANYGLSGSPKENHSPQFKNEKVITNKSVLTAILKDLEAKYIFTCIDCNSCFIYKNLHEHVSIFHPGKTVYCSCGFKGSFNATILHSFELSHLPNETRPLILGSEDGESNLIISLQLKESLQAKIIFNDKKPNHNCKDCFLKFKSVADLYKHNNIYHGKAKSLSCLFCDNLFSNEKKLLQHTLSVHNQYKAFMCLKCYRSFTRFKNLVSHLREYHRILDPYGELERERLTYKKILLGTSDAKHTISETDNSNYDHNNTKMEKKAYSHRHKKSRANQNFDSKYLLRNLFQETVADNVLKYLEEKYIVTCSLCCHKLLFCELDSHIKTVHPEQSVWCSCGFNGELSVVLIHAFNLSHLPTESQPIILRSEMTDFKFGITLKEIEGLPLSYPCFKCSKVFKSVKLCEFHYNICKLEKNIFCDICDKGFALFFHLLMHIATMHEFKCLYCDESFNSNGSLLNHILHNHKDLFLQQCIFNEFDYSLFENQACNFQCKDDYNVLMTEFRMQQIVLTESDLYTSSSDNEFEELQLSRSKKCRKCNDTFNTSTQLKVHSRIHAGTNPHSCQHCSEMFISRNLLSKHNLKIHGKCSTKQNQAIKRKFYKKYSATSDSSDSDEELPSSMVQSTSLYPVENLLHSSKTYQEHYESQIKLTLSDLSTSSSDSENGEAYSLQCKMCDDSFLTSKQFKVHSRLHNGKRPHSCQYCRQTFLSRNLLFKHRLKYHQEFLSKKIKNATRRESTSSSVSCD